MNTQTTLQEGKDYEVVVDAYVTNEDLDLLRADEIVSYWSERWLTNYLSKPENFTKFTEINAMDYLPPYE